VDGIIAQFYGEIAYRFPSPERFLVGIIRKGYCPRSELISVAILREETSPLELSYSPSMGCMDR
jgi:hypothetical protein